jgi:cardiolipin synthase
VDVYTPSRARDFFNRHHIKACAVDDDLMWIGGSNIADHYLTWDDTNLRLRGEIAQRVHRLYNLIAARRPWDQAGHLLRTCGCKAGSGRLCLNLPNPGSSISAALHRLIDNARRGIYLRTWYFLPPRAIEESLISRLKEGVAVNILLSHRTRIPPVDLVNRRVCRRLARAGARILRFHKTYMHAKVYWNDVGEVLLGSANLEPRGLSGNIECSLSLTDLSLVSELQERFWLDVADCIEPHQKIHQQRYVPSLAGGQRVIDRPPRQGR